MNTLSLNMGKSEIDLNHNTELLSALLAKEMTLYIKTRKAQWNVPIEKFAELHTVFESQYKQLNNSINEVVVRIRTEGQNTGNTMLEFSKLWVILEGTEKYASTKEMLKDLSKDHETIIAQLNKNIAACLEKSNDIDMCRFLSSLLDQHERTCWILWKSLKLITIDEKCQLV